MKIEVCNHFNARPLGEIEIDDATHERLQTPDELKDPKKAEHHKAEVETPHGVLRLFKGVVNGSSVYLTNTPDVVAALL